MHYLIKNWFKKTGYIVASGIRRFNGMQGVRFILQSDKQPDNLDERIENFIKSISNILSEMSDEELKRHVDALVVTKLEDPKKISKQCDIYWGEILSHQYNFERGIFRKKIKLLVFAKVILKNYFIKQKKLKLKS